MNDSHSKLTSLRALADCVERINDLRHTSFGVSRRERFEALETAARKISELCREFHVVAHDFPTLHEKANAGDPPT